MAGLMPGFHDYINLYVSTCASHRNQSVAIQQVVDTRITALESKSLGQVMAGVEAGNVDDIIDMVLRCATHSSIP